MFQVSGSESTTTGTAPARTIAAAHEMIVNDGRITSSPRCRFKAATAASSATEPFDTAIPYLRPTFAANFCSNWVTNGPSEEIHPVSMHSATYFFSFPSNSGVLTGMKEHMVIVGL